MKASLRLGLLLLLVAVIGWVVVLRGQVKTFADTSLQVKARTQEVNSYNARLDEVSQIKQDSGAFEGALKALYLAMPKSSQVPETLVMIEVIGSNAGVVFNSATVGTPNGSEVPVNISFTGQLTDVTNFLNAVGQNIRTGIIKNQTITSDSTGTMSVSMQIGLIYQGQGN